LGRRTISGHRTLVLKPERARPFGGSNEHSDCTERANFSELLEPIFIFPLHSNTTYDLEISLSHSELKKKYKIKLCNKLALPVVL